MRSTHLETLRQLAREDALKLRVRGACMAPLIVEGASVEITGHPRYWPGDVILALSQNRQWLLHRVIGCYFKRGRIWILTQADARARPDAAVSAEQILGRVCGGDCDPRIYQVPLGHRLRAIWRFVCFLGGAVVSSTRGRRTSAQPRSGHFSPMTEVVSFWDPATRRIRTGDGTDSI